MPPFPKPNFAYTYSVPTQIQALQQHKAHRQIPAKQQNRRDEDHRLIAEILSWFDAIAVQEVKENFGGLEDVVRILGAPYRYVMSDVAGNNERAAVIYDSQKLTRLEEAGEIAIPPKDLPKIRVAGITQKFLGFDRTPYLATFQAGTFSFELVNVHLFFGSDSAKKDIERRSLETYSVARWVDQREKSKWSFTRDIICLGDFNMPKAQPTDPIYKVLTRFGLEVPNYSTAMGSSIASDAHYDQIAFFPGTTRQDFTGQTGVFDYDKVVFPDLWQASEARFKTYCKYYVSDHRPMWAQFAI
jgi:endonuclease/exonuclease/phosphatase family metal-dependent hydrolase